MKPGMSFRGWVGNHPARFVVDSGVIIISYEFKYYTRVFTIFPNGHIVFRSKERSVR
jgi:hypothetical protein